MKAASPSCFHFVSFGSTEVLPKEIIFKKGKKEMKDKRRLFRGKVLLILLSVFFILICLFPSKLPATGIKEGEAPKEIVLEDLNGRSVNVTDHIGKRPVIIIFWNLTENNTFLDYSVDELRILKDVYEKLHDKTGLEMFAVYVPLGFNGVTDKEISSVRNLIETNGIKFPVLIDSEYKFFKEYGVIAIPSTIMIAETGKIEFMYPGIPVSAY